MRETLGCGHPDKNRACGDCLDEAVEAIERARTYTGLEAEGCPLCTYVDGVFTAACSFHRKLAALELQLSEERERCAKIAEEQRGGTDECCEEHVCNCPGTAIARKIREQTEKRKEI